MMIRENQTIFCEGDSLTSRIAPPHNSTWPYLRLMNWTRTWADHFEELVFAWHTGLNLRTTNSAVGGSNIKGMLARLETHVLPHRPDWIVATIGNNDPNQGIALEEFETLAREYARKAGCKILFLGGFIEKSAAYYEVLRRVAEETGNHYLDAGGALQERQALLKKQCEIHTVYSDGAHLNELGALIIAGEVLDFFFAPH